MDIFVRVLIAFIFGFLMTRSALRNRYDITPKGILRVAYDKDEPEWPKMGLEIDSLEYILNNDKVVLTIQKKGFPSTKRPVYLQSPSKDKSAQ